MLPFLREFCEAVVTLISFHCQLTVDTALIANYDATTTSDLVVTVCPRSNEIERAGRGLLKDRVGISVVFQKRVQKQTYQECMEILNAVRKTMLFLADQDVVVNLPYSVESIESAELFDQNQLEENNVFTSVIDVTYVVTATHG